MAYLDDQAQERERIRQRMLAGTTPLALGDPSPQPQGVELPAMVTQQPMPPGMGELSLQNILGSLSLTPKGVPVKDTPALQAPVVPGRVSAPGSSTWKNDDSLAKALGGMLGGGGGIKDLLARLRAEQAKQAVPAGNVARGANLPPPQGTTQATPGNPRVQAPGGGAPPEQLIPGLKPAIDTSASPQGLPGYAPSAIAYAHEQDKSVPGVRGVEKPAAAPSTSAGPGYSSTLAEQRAPLAAQFDANPSKRDIMGAIMLSEEGDDSASRIRVVEAGANRSNALGLKSIDQTMLDPRYYQPMHDGSGNFEKALQRVQSDPKLRAQLYAEQDEALKKGSDLSKGATDFASGSTAAEAAKHATPTVTSSNGEQFYRKDIDDPIHGNMPAKVRDWYKNTNAARATEAAPGSEPTAPPAPAPQASPPGWLKDTLGTDAAARGVPPGTNLGSADPAARGMQPGLIPPKDDANPAAYEAATKAGSSNLFSPGQTPGAPPFLSPEDALRGSAAATNPVLRPGVPNLGHMGDAHTAMNLTPQEQALYQRHLDNLQGTGGVDNPPTAQNPQGSRSSLFASTFDVDGKTYVIPTVRDGKILPADQAFQAAKAEGLDKFPSYNSRQEADARYGQMHDFMDKDTGDYFAMKNRPQQMGPVPNSSAPTALPPGQQDLRSSLWAATNSNQPMPQMTPQMAQALVGAVKAEDVAAAMPPSPPGAQPVLPVTNGPSTPGAPGGSAAPGTAPGVELPPGNAPLMMQQASQGNPIAMAGLSPVAPVQPSAPLSTPLTAQATAFPNALQPPIPYSEMAGWGWSAPDVSSSGWSGWSGGGFDGGLAGGFGVGE